MTRTLLFALTLLGCSSLLCAAAPRPVLSAEPQPAIAAAAPAGRIIIDGAYSAAAGSPATYALTYVADAALVGKTLRVSLKDSNPVDRMVKNAKTGVEEKKRVPDPQTSFISLTLKAASGVEKLSLPEPKAKDSTLELCIVEAEKPTALSNSLTLKPAAGVWALPEAADVQKMLDAMPAKPTAQPGKPRKILCYTWAGGFIHSSIPFCARAVQIMGSKTGAWQAVISNDKFMFEPQTLAQFDAVVMCSTTGSLFGEKDKQVNERLRKSLVDFVASGKGLAGSHAATDCSYDWKEYGEMMGGYFQGHPFSKHFTKIDDPASPINATFKGQGFEFSDEMYTFKDPYSRQKLRILVSIHVEKSKWADDPAKPGFKKGENRNDHDYAISWIREYGKGRVFYCSYGHNHPVFWTSPLLQHYLDGIQYALGDLKANATPSAAK